jgi:Xaa-Pro aminopeptidase
MSAVLKPAVAPSRMRDPISTAELERRWAATRAAMKTAGLDALVVQSKEDWMNGYSRWFTDQPATNAYPRSVLFPLEGLMSAVDVGDFGKEIVLDGTDPMQRGVGRRTFVPSFNGAVDYNGKYDAELMAAEIRRGSHKRVGLVRPNGMYHGFVEGLKESLKDVKFENASDLVDDIKAIKSPEEIDFVRRCAEMQDAAFARVLEKIRPGMRDNDITALAQYEGRLLGSEQGLFLGTSAPLGQRSDFLDRHQQGRTLQKGEHYTLLIENNDFPCFC